MREHNRVHLRPFESRDGRRASTGVDDCRVPGPEELSRLPAIGGGAVVATEDGPTPVDWLRPGDRVLTRDHGFQPLLWIGRHVAPRRAHSSHRPLRLPQDAFGAAAPDQPLLATPGLGLLLSGAELSRWFGAQEMFADLATIADGAFPTAEESLAMHTLLTARPAVLLIGGLWMASATATPAYLSLIPADKRDAIARAGAEAGGAADGTARRWMQDWEVNMFRRDRAARRRALAA